MNFFGIPHFLSMTELSGGTNNLRFFFSMVCRFKNGAKYFCRSTNEVAMTKNVKQIRSKKNNFSDNKWLVPCTCATAV